jgi:uncharacterized protein (TIGR01777 family)
LAILLTGASGYLGQQIIGRFGKTYDIIALKHTSNLLNPGVRVISSLDDLSDETHLQGIINLSGAKISKRWTNDYKNTLKESRINTTKALVHLIQRLQNPPKFFISASAIGYYGAKTRDQVTETTSPDPDFMHELCHAWESPLSDIGQPDMRTYIMRLGVVLGKGSGFLKEILPIFSMGLGGKIGTGHQFLSWIHVQDVLGTLEFMIEKSPTAGTYNLTSPHPVTNACFTKTLGHLLKRPTLFNMPQWFVKLAFGEMGENLLLKGPAVYPKKLLKEGYAFQFPELDEALSQILK